MKKYIILISLIYLVLLMFWSCEKDDICIEENTPHLIIRFFDHENPKEYKKVIQLKVQIEGIDGDYTNETITVLTDSIAIPIKVTEDITRFKLILNGNDQDDTNDNEDIFDLNYIREDVFVSRSCGYKTLYYEVKPLLINDNDNWIKSIETVKDPQDILNQNSDHVKIFH
ncbi:MAG: hypothetical protein J7K34_00715 [Flavobacteriaceae bacterium]|nr:hypothetical protein [Flavobacteriaceae bacterium]